MVNNLVSVLKRTRRFSLFCIFLSLRFISSNAQEDLSYVGFEVNFGIKSTQLTSDHNAIDGMTLMVEGGTLGFVIGNHSLKTRLQASGFYYSGATVEHTVNVFASGLVVNFYPINLMNRASEALNPYMTSGITYNILKFEGYYTIEDSKINHSRSSAPYIGKICIPSATAGFGLEWRLPRIYDFIHIFAEARYSYNLKSNSDEVLRHTTIDNPVSVNAGVNFGFLR